MQITQFDKNTRGLLNQRVQRALKTLEEEMGVSFSVNAKPVNARTTSLDITCSVGDEVDLKDTPLGQTFVAMAKVYGLEPEMLGRTTMIMNGRKPEYFRILGLKTGRPKNPIELERVSDGRNFKAPAELVSRGIQR